MLQNSKIAEWQFPSHNRIQPTTANLCGRNRFTEVTREFVVGR